MISYSDKVCLQAPQGPTGLFTSLLFEAAEIAKFSLEDRAAYESSLKYYRDLKNVVDTSRQEGLEEGYEQGIEQGIEQGKITIAKAMKASGESVEKIMLYTQLSKEQIEAL